MSEKYDGIRAYWTSYNLMARTGRQIRIPDKFRDGFPVMALDGELWYFTLMIFEKYSSFFLQDPPRTSTRSFNIG